MPRHSAADHREVTSTQLVAVALAEAIETGAPAARLDRLARQRRIPGMAERLQQRLRSGEMDAATPGLLAALRANAADQIAIDQPTYAPEPR